MKKKKHSFTAWVWYTRKSMKRIFILSHDESEPHFIVNPQIKLWKKGWEDAEELGKKIRVTIEEV